MKLQWVDEDSTGAVAQGLRHRYIAWNNGTLSGHGRTEYHETVTHARLRAQQIEDGLRADQASPAGEGE